MNFSEYANIPKEAYDMRAVKIAKRHQITIPKEIFDNLHLREGDMLEAQQEGGKIVLIPKTLVNKAPVQKLTEHEQNILVTAKEKIVKINKDIIHSRGLNTAEIRVAVKAGLIDHEQAYWWHEDWQKGEREAEKDIAAGRVSMPHDTIEDALKDLRS